MSMNWSSYQTHIFDNVRNTDANLAVSAVAGSGKTTTLVQIVNELDTRQSVLFATFNKHIATELGSRLGDKADAKTLHASGMKLLSKVRKIRVDENKYFTIIRIKYKGQLAWQAQQEQNLEYVAVTRAKEKLFLANE